METFSVIITAGGIGKRMGSSLPKQFIEVKGLPILMHTIRCFNQFDPTCQILVTLPEDWMQFWQELLLKHHFALPHQVVEGGIERYDSIKNALDQCVHNWIAVHDGVRPLVSHATIQRCFDEVKIKKAVIPTIAPNESLRILADQGTKAVKRSDYLFVQTPQFFQAELLTKAYSQPFHPGITDDASLVEEAGFAISITDGNDENIKITTQKDLKIAELFLK